MCVPVSIFFDLAGLLTEAMDLLPSWTETNHVEYIDVNTLRATKKQRSILYYEAITEIDAI